MTHIVSHNAMWGRKTWVPILMMCSWGMEVATTPKNSLCKFLPIFDMIFIAIALIAITGNIIWQEYMANHVGNSPSSFGCLLKWIGKKIIIRLLDMN